MTSDVMRACLRLRLRSKVSKNAPEKCDFGSFIALQTMRWTSFFNSGFQSNPNPLEMTKPGSGWVGTFHVLQKRHNAFYMSRRTSLRVVYVTNIIKSAVTFAYRAWGVQKNFSAVRGGKCQVRGGGKCFPPLTKNFGLGGGISRRKF